MYQLTYLQQYSMECIRISVQGPFRQSVLLSVVCSSCHGPSFHIGSKYYHLLLQLFYCIHGSNRHALPLSSSYMTDSNSWHKFVGNLWCCRQLQLHDLPWNNPQNELLLCKLDMIFPRSMPCGIEHMQHLQLSALVKITWCTPLIKMMKLNKSTKTPSYRKKKDALQFICSSSSDNVRSTMSADPGRSFEMKGLMSSELPVPMSIIPSSSKEI